MEQLGTIYIATNLLNGKQYVGQTVRTLRERIRGHKHQKGMLNTAIKKYGIENFKWVSFSCPEEELDWQESFLIKELGSLVPNGYNLESGGNKSKHHHNTTIEKIRKNHKNNMGEKNGMFGRKGNKHPNFGKVGEKNPLFGIKRSKDIVENLKGEKNPWFGKGHLQTGEKNPMFGKSFYSVWVEKYGPEIANEKLSLWRKKQSESHCRENTPGVRSVVLVSPGGLKFQISNLFLFCKENQLSYSHIYKVLRGEKKYHKGWTARYIERINKEE